MNYFKSHRQIEMTSLNSVATSVVLECTQTMRLI